MLNLLSATPDMIIADSIPEDEEEYEKAPFKLHGCVLTLVERLDEEFTKLLKECDPHSNEYVERCVKQAVYKFINRYSIWVIKFNCIDLM